MTRNKKHGESETNTSIDSTNEAEALAVRVTGIDLDTIRKVKELCDRYGAEAFKRLVG
jgi:hypothetical protein